MQQVITSANYDTIDDISMSLMSNAALQPWVIFLSEFVLPIRTLNIAHSILDSLKWSTTVI